MLFIIFLDNSSQQILQNNYFKITGYQKKKYLDKVVTLQAIFNETFID